MSSPEIEALVTELNHQYLKVHTEKENSYWTTKMNLQGNQPGDYESKEIRFQDFIAAPAYLPRIREALKTPVLTEENRWALKGWLRFFEVNALENEAAKGFRAKVIEKETELQRSRRDMKLGYTDPKEKKFVEVPIEVLSLKLATSKEPEMRKAAWEGLRSVEQHLLAEGYIEVVKLRNQYAKLLGYEDYYDYKVSLLEGFPKKKLFEILDDLEKNTRAVCQRSIDDLAKTHGDSARDPWNFGHYISGELTPLVDPYFQFDAAVARWGKSFAALGINYQGATLTLDLVSRKRKYENGFMHGPFPAYTERGKLHPARINFTANAVPGSVGSGLVALETLLHEGGHAAHFSNIRMPAPCFSQEFAPTSSAFAETQSMFLDGLASEPDWCARYAVDNQGRPMPRELMNRRLEKSHRYQAFYLRALLGVCYAEKAIYEMPESSLTPDRILAAVREVESRLLCIRSSPRPILAVPHLISGEASATYHAYVLAQMAVFQTRDYFLERYGHIMDNPAVGRDLTERYWKPGNAKTFLEMVEDLTGTPFSAKSTIRLFNKEIPEMFEESNKALTVEKTIPPFKGAVDLNCQIHLIHGDEEIASNVGGTTFEGMAETYGAWIRAQAGTMAKLLIPFLLILAGCASQDRYKWVKELPVAAESTLENARRQDIRLTDLYESRAVDGQVWLRGQGYAEVNDRSEKYHWGSKNPPVLEISITHPDQEGFKQCQILFDQMRSKKKAVRIEADGLFMARGGETDGHIGVFRVDRIEQCVLFTPSR